MRNKKAIKFIAAVSAILLSIFCFTGCIPAGAKPVTNDDITLIQFEPIEDGQDIAIVKTNYGDFKMVLYTEQAPKTVENFKKLVEADFYDGNKFFAIDRTVNIIFGGASDEYGHSGEVMTDNNKKVPLEKNADLWHFSGAVSAYGEVSGFNSMYSDSDSRFMIVGTKEPQKELIEQMEYKEFPQKVIDKYSEVGGMPQYSGSFTVFGQIYEGLEIIDDLIKNTEVDEDTLMPKEDIIINDIVLDTYKSE